MNLGRVTGGLTTGRIVALAIAAYALVGLVAGFVAIQTVVTVVLFVVILGGLVLVHEFGHFVAARIARVRVLEFGIGFPPRAKVLTTRGDTTYTLNWLPIGGFVKLEGEDGDGVEDERSFSAQKLRTKVAILVAGVAVNVLVAFVLLTGITAFADPAMAIRVSYVDPGSPAAAAGLVEGDVIERLDGRLYGGFPDSQTILDALRSHAGETVTLSVRHADGTVTDATATLRSPSEIGPQRGALGIGTTGKPITAVELPTNVPHDAIESAVLGARRTGWAMGVIVGGVKDLFVGAVTHPTEAPQASGPIGIAQTIGNVFYSAGIPATLYLVAVLSANLAVVNILPFPPLDGGRVLMLVLKALFGKRISLRAERLTYVVGFVFLFAFIVWISAFDVIRSLTGGG